MAKMAKGKRVVQSGAVMGCSWPKREQCYFFRVFNGKVSMERASLVPSAVMT